MSLIQAPTNRVWMLGRTQVNSQEDGAKVVWKIQDNYAVVPLSQSDKSYTPPKGTVPEETKSVVPVKDVRALPLADYLNLVSKLIVDNPPAPADSAIISAMKSIGLEAGKEFSMNAFGPELHKELNTIPETVHSKWVAILSGREAGNLKNGWMLRTEGIGTYGTDYNTRALIAYLGLGANLAEDAVYPNAAVDADGQPLNGENKYLIHFEKNQIPPVRAFWSLTAYDSRNLLVDNPIRRYALGDRDKLMYNKDGSLDIYLQNANPGKAKESNWLPSPKEGKMDVTFRLYWPKPAVLDGSWTPPPIRRVK